MKTVEIYGQKGCRYCVAAVEYARSMNLPHVYRDIADPHARKEMFLRNPVAKTVPQIFIGDTLIGGHDEFVARPLAQLQQMIGE